MGKLSPARWSARVRLAGGAGQADADDDGVDSFLVSDFDPDSGVVEAAPTARYRVVVAGFCHGKALGHRSHYGDQRKCPINARLTRRRSSPPRVGTGRALTACSVAFSMLIPLLIENGASAPSLGDRSSRGASARTLSMVHSGPCFGLVVFGAPKGSVCSVAARSLFDLHRVSPAGRGDPGLDTHVDGFRRRRWRDPR